MKKSRVFLVFMLILALVFTQAAPVYAVSTTVKAPILKSVTYDEDDSCVIVKWSKVSGAGGYQIYRAESKDGKYSRVATVKSSKSSYTDKKIENDNTYYYKVRAYKTVDGKKKYSKYSSRKSVRVWAAAETLDFNVLLEEATEKHGEEQTNPTAFNNFTDFLVEGSEYKNLLTQEEIDSLRNLNKKQPSSLTYKEAAADVELLFRTLKYSYGAYFYFGGEERFDMAEKEVMSKLEGKKTVKTETLRTYLRNSLSFVRDGHFGIGPSAIEDEAVRFEYFYSDIYFSKDDNGYYKEIDGKKWYYKSCSDKDARIEPTLTADGDIMYGLVLFCPATETDLSDSITLKCGSEKKNMPVKWTEQSTINASGRTQDYIFEEVDGISYVSIRCFNPELSNDTYRKYMESGTQVRDSKLVIYDIRTNGGGSDEYGRNWVNNFAGKAPQLKNAFSNRMSALVRDGRQNTTTGSEKYTYILNEGLVLKNNVPVILLVDDRCGSAGESALNFAKAMENVIVIGSNSSGYQLCGNVADYQLTNSGIYFKMPVSLQFTYNMNNVDGKGYEPDIWCNPADALEAAYNLIIKAGYADDETIKELKEKIEAATPDIITMKWDKYTINEGEGFGCTDFNDTVTICANGKKITDYKVTFEDPSCGTATEKSDGSLQLKSKKQGQWNLYIEYKGVKHRFSWATF